MPRPQTAFFVVAASLACLAGAAALGQTPAFPGAEGFGRFATGARTNLAAASLYRVTNLNASGPGSFRDAVSQPDRFVIFDVGGIVTLAPTDPAIVAARNVTIAGQTAPGNFVVYGNRVSYSGADNSITRYLGVHKGQAGYREDAVSLANGANMMFDHMSVTWGVDETFSLNWDGKGNSIDRITIQDSVIAQGQDRLGHSAGGLMTLPEGGRFSVIRSVFADNVTRNPKVRGEQEFINNVVYGWESAAYIMGDTTSMDSHANVIGNYFIEGPVNGGGPFSGGTANFSIYGADNWVDPDRDGFLDGTPVTSYPGATVASLPHAFPTTAAMPAAEAVNHVMKHAGLSIVRDVVDARIMEEIASFGTLGGVIQRETDLFPGYGSDPAYLQPRGRLPDADHDGIADGWELAHGLSPANPNDWKGLSPAGYTWLEEYANELGAPGAAVASLGGVWTAPGTWTEAAPTLADDASVFGTVSIPAGGHAFARRLGIAGAVQVTDGTLDVFDTVEVSRGTLQVGGGTAGVGRLLLGSPGQTAAVVVSAGGILRSGPLIVAGGTASIALNGGTLAVTTAGPIAVPATLGTAGGTLDTGSLDVSYSGPITGSGGLLKTGGGRLTLAGSNTYAGGTVLAGPLRLASSTAAGSGPIRIAAAGGTVLLADGVTIANEIRTDYSFEVIDVPDANASATLAGSLSGNGSRQVRLRTTGSGATLNLTGSITARYGFYLTEGNLMVSGTGSVSGGRGAAVGRNNSVSLTLEDEASFNVGGFSMGGTRAMPNGVITVRNDAVLSTGGDRLDLLATSSATSFSELNLDGGTTTVGGFLKSSTGGTQRSEIDFNGGLLRYGGAAANPEFLPALAGLTANVQAGGARIDDGGQAITISQPLIHDPALPGGDGGLVKTGGGTLTLAAANSYVGPTTVVAGVLEAAHSAALAQTRVTVEAGAMLRVAGGRLLNSPGITLAGGGLDLGAGGLRVAAGGITAEALRAELLAGRNGGGWDAAAGIVSAAAAASGGTREVGYVVAGDGSAVVSFAAAGDADLDGEVNVFDLIGIDAAGRFGTGAASVWSEGDFNYDGVTNVFDLIGIDGSGVYGTGGYLPAAPAALAGRSVAAVPEPAPAGLAALAGLALVSARGAIRPARRRAGLVAVAILLVLGTTAGASAGTVVRFTTNLGVFDVDLFDATMPTTVANFLDYAASDRYVSTIFHRSTTYNPFDIQIIQGGGFLLTDTEIFPVETDPPIPLEPSTANLRGTIAMARASDPDSATSQWYFNVTDNPGLDFEYAVFGNVIGTGLDVIDTIAAVQVYDASSQLGPTFAQLPLTQESLAPESFVLVDDVAIVSPWQLTIDVPAGTQTQAEAGYPSIATAASVTKTGPGTLVFDAANAYGGPTTVAAGTLVLANDAALAAGSVTVTSGATLEVASGTAPLVSAVSLEGGTLTASSLVVDAISGIGSLSIAAGTVAGTPAIAVTGGGVMTLPGEARLTVAATSLLVDKEAGGGLLDLGAGELTIAPGGATVASLRADLVAGRNGGGWDGATGITSSTAADSGGRAVGYLVAADGSARVSFAAPGDVDLSGTVNVFDLIEISTSGKYGTGETSIWSQGDFNYDRVSNVFDLVEITTSGVYGTGNYFPAAVTPAGVAAAVPEPAAAMLPGLLLGWLAIRRKSAWMPGFSPTRPARETGAGLGRSI